MGVNYNPGIVTNGLVLCLDAANKKSYSGSGNTWIDLSGSNNSGTLINSPTFSSANNGSFAFNGSNNYVTLNSPMIPGTTSFTVCLWLNYTISGGNFFNDIINNRNAVTPYSGFLLTTDASATTGKIRVQLNDASTTMTYQNAAGANIATGTWNYVCISTDRTNSIMNYYVNGKFDSTFNISSVGNISSNTNLYIAYDAAFAGSGNRFPGNISTVKIYNRALSQSEVSQNFNALRGRYGI